MTERYIEHVSTESPELIRANECEWNIGTLVTYRFRRLWNEIVDLREQLDAAHRTTPDREAIRNAALDEAAAVVSDPVRKGREWVPGSLWDNLARESADRIRALKTAPNGENG